MMVWYSAGTNRVRNNILYHPSTSRGSITYASATDVANTDSDYNVITNVTPNDGGTLYTLAQWQTQGHELHSITATPATLFVDPAAANYHLKTGSPAIDKGQTLATVPKDIEGKARPVGAGWDLGAYEGAERKHDDGSPTGRVDLGGGCDGFRQLADEDRRDRLGQRRRRLHPADRLGRRLRRVHRLRDEHLPDDRPLQGQHERLLRGHRLRHLPVRRARSQRLRGRHAQGDLRHLRDGRQAVASPWSAESSSTAGTGRSSTPRRRRRPTRSSWTPRSTPRARRSAAPSSRALRAAGGVDLGRRGDGHQQLPDEDRCPPPGATPARSPRSRSPRATATSSSLPPRRTPTG